MLLRSLTLIIFLLAILETAVMGVTVQNNPRAQGELNRLIEAAGNPTITKDLTDSLVANDKTAIIDALRDVLKKSDDSMALNILINLGDDEAIAKAVREFQQRDDVNIFEAIHPKIIVATAPYLFINEPYEIRGGELNIEPKSYTTAEMLRRLLVRSPYFTPEVNRWAAAWPDMGGSYGVERFRQMMRDWWNVNKAYFAAGNYSAVRPGSPPPEISTGTTQQSSPQPSPSSFQSPKS